jgi:hypothetical protein
VGVQTVIFFFFFIKIMYEYDYKLIRFHGECSFLLSCLDLRKDVVEGFSWVQLGGFSSGVRLGSWG